MAKGKTGGRKAGVPNKVSGTVKDNILAVFNRLDGTSGMAKWAESNQTEFYKMYSRLLPTETPDLRSVELSGPDGQAIPIITKMVVEIVSPKNSGR